MNFCSVPYEADYGMYADSKMKSVPQYPMNMNPGQGQGQAMNVQPLNPPQMNLQMQMPSGIPQMSSYPMQGMPLNMMPGGGNGGMTPMSTMSTQLPIGAMAPLSSMTMVPMMGNTMGSIDAPGINAVLPDLQPMSTMGQMQPMSQMGQMGQMQPMQQFGQSDSSTQLHQGRLTGGASSPCPSSPSHACSWNPNHGQMMANSSGSNGGGMWQYSQPMQQHQQQPQYQQAPQYQHQQHQHHQHQQQQHQQQQHHNHAQQQQQQQQAQQQQQGHRMKSTYDLAPAIQYRDVRNGLNSPSMHDSSKYSKGNNSFNCGKTVSKVPHWR